MAGPSIAIAIPRRPPSVTTGRTCWRAATSSRPGSTSSIRGSSSRRRNKPAGNYELRFNNGVPTQIITFNYPVTPTDFARYVGVFGQDAWSIGRLNLVAGLRFSTETAFEPAACRVATEFAAAACFDRIDMARWTTWMPHVQAAYDVLGDGKVRSRGRIRALCEPARHFTGADPHLEKQRAVHHLDLARSERDALYDTGEVDLESERHRIFEGSAGATNAIVNPNEPQPKSDEWSLTFEREVMRNWAIWATGMYATNFDLRRLAEPLRPRSAYNIAITNPHPGMTACSDTADDPAGKNHHLLRISDEPQRRRITRAR